MATNTDLSPVPFQTPVTGNTGLVSVPWIAWFRQLASLVQSSSQPYSSPTTTKGDLIVRGPTTDSRLGVGSNTQVLTADSTQALGVKWATPSPSFANPMTTLGDIIYESSTPAAARLAGNTSATKMFLSQTGTGSVSAIPAWGQPDFTDITGTLGVSSGGTGQTSFTDGQLLIGSTSGNTLTPATLTAGSGVTITNGGGSITIAASGGGGGSIVPSTTVNFYDDFLIQNIANSTSASPWTTLVSGTASGVSSSTSSNNAGHPGVYDLTTGTTTSGYATLFSVAAGPSFGSGAITYETDVKLPALSNGTNRYSVWAGIKNHAIGAPTTPGNGIYFTYSDNATSGHWVLNCTSGGGTTTSVDTGVSATTSWTRLGFTVDAGGTTVQAYVNGIAAGSAITTNIPTSVFSMCFEWNILKSLGTSTADLYVDYVYFNQTLTTPR